MLFMLGQMSCPGRVLHLSGFYLDLVLLVNFNKQTDVGKCGLKTQTAQKRTEQQKKINRDTIRNRAR